MRSIGGGIDVRVTPRIAIRVLGDLRFFTGDEATTQVRFAAGVVFAIGGR